MAADRTVRVVISADASGLIAAAQAGESALIRMGRVDATGSVAGMRSIGTAATSAATETVTAMDRVKASIGAQVGVVNIAAMGIMGAFMGVVGVLKSTVSAGVEYQTTMFTLQAATHATADVMDVVGAKARALGMDMTLPATSATDAAKAMLELSKGGLTVQQAMDAAYGSLTLAAAAHVSAAKAAEIQVNVLNTFGLAANQAGLVADTLTNASNHTSGSVADMADAMFKAGGTAKMFGWSITDTASVLSVFAKNGYIGAEGGTVLNTMLTKLAAPSKQAAAALDELGVKVHDSSGHMITARALMEALIGAQGRMTDAAYATATAHAFGSRGIRGAGAASRETEIEFALLNKQIDLQGGASDMAGAKMQGLGGAFENFKNNVQELQLKIMDGLNPALTTIVNDAAGVAQGIGAVANVFGSLPGPVQNTAIALGAVLLLHRPLEFMWTMIATNVRALPLLFEGASFSMAGFKVAAVATMDALKAAFLTNPIGIAIVGITAAMSLFSSTTDDASKSSQEFSDVIDQQTGKLKDNAAQSIATSVETSGLGAAVRALGGDTKLFVDAIAGVPGKLDEANKFLADHKKVAGDVTQADWNMANAVDGTTVASENLSTATRLLNEKVGHLSGALSLQKNTAYGASQTLTTLADGTVVASDATTTLTDAQQKGIDALQKMQAKMADSTYITAFTNDMTAAKEATKNADLAAQALSVTLLQTAGGQMTLDKAQRASDASLRLIASTARAHDTALDDITKKEQALQDLRDHGTTKAGDLEKAQDAADKAAAAASKSQTELLKAQENATRALAAAQDALTQAQEKGAKEEQAAQDALVKAQDAGAKAQAAAQAALEPAQEKAAIDLRNAKEALAKLQANPTSSPIALRDAQEKVAATTEAGAKAVADAQQKIQDTAASSADAVKQAQQKIRDVHDSTADAIKNAQQRVKDTQTSGAAAIVAAQERVTAALQGVADAQENVAKVQAASVPTAMALAEATRAVAAAKDAEKAASDAQADANDKAGAAARALVAAQYAVKAASGDMQGGIDAATGSMGTARDAFIAAYVAAHGLTDGQEAARAKAEELANQMGLIPDQVTKFFTLSGIDGAIDRAKALNAELAKTTLALEMYASGPNVYSVFSQSIPVSALQALHGDGTALPGPYGTGIPAHAAGGWITKGTGPRTDDVPILASKGEFVVNAESAARNRALLEAINSRVLGFADGGPVPGAADAIGVASVALSSSVSVPDVSKIQGAWDAIAGAVKKAWDAMIQPTLTGLTLGIGDVSKTIFALRDNTVLPVWDRIGSKTLGTVTDAVLPAYDKLNAGTGDVAQRWQFLLDRTVKPVWDAIDSTVRDAWARVLKPTYEALNTGTNQTGSAFHDLDVSAAVSWANIGAAVGGAYTTQIAPAWTGVQGFANGMGGFFTGIQTGMTTASTQVTTDLGSISAAIDAFFKMVDTKAPVAAAGAAAGVHAIPGHADGGMITMGTGPRADDVHIRASKGEYVVNAASTAKHKSTLDAINYGGAYADGGLIGDKISTDIRDAVLSGAQRAIQAGVGRIFADSTGGSTATGFNASQDPSSFGWVRAANISPFSWNGNDVAGGVASGTGGLWTALLNALVPQIPGGLMGTLFGYENRNNVNNPGVPSFHSYGLAVDVNSAQNPNGAPGYGRSGPGVIPSGLAHSLAAQLGMLWGGDFNGTPDPMHFEIHVPPSGIGAAAPAASGSWLQDVLARIAGGTPATSGGAGSVAYSLSGGVEQWRPTVLQSLQILGQSLSLADTVLHQMQTESSGNPNAINLTDINAQRGIPSKGLVQVIDPTFRTFAVPPYNQNIWDPLSNILAGENYAIHQYGSILAGMRGVAYAGGGIVPGMPTGVDTVPAWLSPGEAVISRSLGFKDKNKGYLDEAASWFGGRVVYPGAGGQALTPQFGSQVVNVAAPNVTVYVDGNLMTADRVSAVVDGKLASVAAGVNRASGQR